MASSASWSWSTEDVNGSTGVGGGGDGVGDGRQCSVSVVERVACRQVQAEGDDSRLVRECTRTREVFRRCLGRPVEVVESSTETTREELPATSTSSCMSSSSSSSSVFPIDGNEAGGYVGHSGVGGSLSSSGPWWGSSEGRAGWFGGGDGQRGFDSEGRDTAFSGFPFHLPFGLDPRDPSTAPYAADDDDGGGGLRVWTWGPYVWHGEWGGSNNRAPDCAPDCVENSAPNSALKEDQQCGAPQGREHTPRALHPWRSGVGVGGEEKSAAASTSPASGLGGVMEAWLVAMEAATRDAMGQMGRELEGLGPWLRKRVEEGGAVGIGRGNAGGPLVWEEGEGQVGRRRDDPQPNRQSSGSVPKYEEYSRGFDEI